MAITDNKITQFMGFEEWGDGDNMRRVINEMTIEELGRLAVLARGGEEHYKANSESWGNFVVKIGYIPDDHQTLADEDRVIVYRQVSIETITSSSRQRKTICDGLLRTLRICGVNALNARWARPGEDFSWARTTRG